MTVLALETATAGVGFSVVGEDGTVVEHFATRPPAQAESLLVMLERGFAEAVSFPVEGPPVPPSELMRKRPLVLAPGVFAPPEPIHAAMLRAAHGRITSEIGPDERQPLPLFVLIGRNLGEEHDAGPAELVERVDRLRRLGNDVLVARAPEVYRIVRYALRYTNAPLRVVIGAAALADLMQRRHYRSLDGEVMEALAQLFATNVRVYVYPMPAATLERLDPSAAADCSVMSMDPLRPAQPKRRRKAMMRRTQLLVKPGVK